MNDEDKKEGNSSTVAVLLLVGFVILCCVLVGVINQIANDTSDAYLPDYIPDDTTWVNDIDSWGLTVKGNRRADIYQFLNPFLQKNDARICELFCKNKITIIVETKGLEETYYSLGTGYRQECMSGAQSKIQLQLETPDHETIVISNIYEISPPDTTTCPKKPPTFEATKYAIATALLYIMQPDTVDVGTGTATHPLSKDEVIWHDAIDQLSQ